MNDQAANRFDFEIAEQGTKISNALNMLRMQQYPPDARKGLRKFQIAEVADLIGVTQSHLRQLHIEGKGPEVETIGGRRFYTASQMLELRDYLESNKKSDKRFYVPRRKEGEPLQVISVVNFKGGSGKTTTAAHLAQYLALTGHRVLAIDLDPQASLTSMFGIQPELDETASLYEALRFDDERKPIAEIIQKTNVPNLNIVPANLVLQEYEYDVPLAISGKKGEQGRLFHMRIVNALKEVDSDYDVVIIDCPPQLGYLTITALMASTGILITIHPQMLDIMSMSQFLTMLGGILTSIAEVGAEIRVKWFRYLITRFEPTDIPQAQMVGFMQSMFAQNMLNCHVLKSTAISDASIRKQTLYEVDRTDFVRATYDRAMESLNASNGEIADIIHSSWGRR
ncbi:MAG: plasmid partitioning protein RepA [Hyphomicrobiaceae bacterium]|nr:plasmid partitioning protein RepA [Hyphomicrobiaceae bacterium]MCC0013991.1 plasmid partitioning protein RepA [Rhodobiaceae bacterium]|tara:strand:- start:2805 stop:3995 length:1191 start_codon:yes stop_codon:yes gene_type:complete